MAIVEAEEQFGGAVGGALVAGQGGGEKGQFRPQPLEQTVGKACRVVGLMKVAGPIECPKQTLGVSAGITPAGEAFSQVGDG